MSNLLATALLGLAIIVGSLSAPALAQDSTAKIKPCLGELCPPKAPRDDMPKQMNEGANQVEQTQGKDQASSQVMPHKKKQASFHRNRYQQSSAQVMPRKKKQASFHRNPYQESSAQVMPRKKKQVSNRQQQPSKMSTSRPTFWDWLF